MVDDVSFGVCDEDDAFSRAKDVLLEGGFHLRCKPTSEGIVRCEQKIASRRGQVGSHGEGHGGRCIMCKGCSWGHKEHPGVFGVNWKTALCLISAP